jgi:ATP-dependent helicase/nuclease subunit A
VEFKGDSWERTDIAKNLQGKYKEIFIDEYQDTNQAQNIIFEAISRNRENLYCVGDVKQSIYKFRLASPQLFMELKKNLPDYDGIIHPSQITLDKNFRSRNGVTQVTNHLFKTLMSERVGEIDYNEKEYLVCGATYPEKNTPDVGLMCLDYSEYKSADAIALEAE